MPNYNFPSSRIAEALPTLHGVEKRPAIGSKQSHALRYTLGIALVLIITLLAVVRLAGAYYTAVNFY